MDCENCTGCHWRINSAEYEDCFWLFIAGKSNENGVMQSMSQAEVSEILGIPQVKLAEVQQTAIEALQEIDGFEDLAELYK